MFNFWPRNKYRKDFKIVKYFLLIHLDQLLKKKENVPADVLDVMRSLIEQAVETYEAMYILLEKKHLNACAALARSLYESSINLQYILKENTEERARNFKQAAMVKFNKRYSNLKTKENPEAHEWMRFMKEQVKGYKPDGKRLTEKMEEVRSSSTHKEAYGRLSEYVHSGYRANLDLGDGPFTEYLTRVLFHDSLIVFGEGLMAVCEQYDLDVHVIIIDSSSYKGTVVFHTNPKKAEEELWNSENHT